MKLILVVLVLAFTVTADAQTIRKWKITDYEKYVAASKDKILVINFWATFCKPCIAEIPGFISVANKYKANKVELMLVSLDVKDMFPKKLSAFIKSKKFNTQHAWLDETDADIFCPRVDPNWSGSIPATVIINTATGVRLFFEEELSAKELEQAIIKVR